jgi:hypothetical protein
MPEKKQFSSQTKNLSRHGSPEKVFIESKGRYGRNATARFDESALVFGLPNYPTGYGRCNRYRTG